MEKHSKKINLRYVFTADEASENAQKMASAVSQMEELEDTKKSVVSQYNSQIAAQKEQLNVFTKLVSNGYQYKDVECIVHWHKPEKGMMTLERTDIEEGDDRMEKYLTEKMSEIDWSTWDDFYKESECDVMMHTPDTGKKTYTHKETGVTFIENMSLDDKQQFKDECEITYHSPEQGLKTYSHRETGQEVVLDMQEEDYNLWNQEGAEKPEFDKGAEMEAIPEYESENEED
jgi:hypothetical protein